MIKIDMPMPRCCSECPFYSGYNWGHCLADTREVWDCMSFGSIYVVTDRHQDCPLQEVDDND